MSRTDNQSLLMIMSEEGIVDVLPTTIIEEMVFLVVVLTTQELPYTTMNVH